MKVPQECRNGKRAREVRDDERGGRRVRQCGDHGRVLGHLPGDLPLSGWGKDWIRRERAGRAEVRSSTEQNLRDLRFDLTLWKAQQYWEVCEM
jgi:hypothetical protein